MSYYAHQMEIALTGRAGDWLARRAWPHLTMAVAFALSAGAALECSRHLVGWGGFALRYSVTFLAAYAVFVLCLGLWLRAQPSLDHSALLDGAPESIETKDPWDDEASERREELVEQARGSAEQQARLEGAQGLMALAIAGLLLGTIFAAAHMMWHARWYLGRLLVLGGKVRHRMIEEPPAISWLTSPLRLTIAAAVILLAHYALLGLLLQWMFPNAVTVADIVRPIRP